MSDGDTLEDMWRKSFAPDEARIDDAFFRTLIGMYRARAQLYQAISFGLLVATIVVIFGGVYTFIRGDTRNEVLATSEVDLIDRIRRKQEVIDTIDSDAARANESVSVLQRSKVLTHNLFHSKTGLNGLLSGPTKSLSVSCISVNRASLRILERLSKPTSEKTTVIILPDLNSSESNSFPAAAFTVVSEEANAVSIDLTVLSKELKEITELLESIGQKDAANKDGTLTAEDTRAIKVLVDGAAQLSKVDELFSSVSDKAKKAEENDQSLRENQLLRQNEKQKLAKEKEDLERDLTNVREQREKILFMSWIPGLTLRVGTVILLLFLTQIMLSTYRYTLGVSGFYLARSDAVQLLQSATESSNRYLPEQLITLMEAMTPSRYQIDPVRDPTDQLSDLAKSWISRFKP